jgi:hypothetical protein
LLQVQKRILNTSFHASLNTEALTRQEVRGWEKFHFNMSSAAVPPPPPKRGMGMDHDLQPASYAIVNILFVIGTISILLRCYSRASIVRQFGWDDWIMAAILVYFSI